MTDTSVAPECIETTHRDGRGGVIQVRTIVGPATRPWSAYEESGETGWSAGVQGPYLIATRVTTGPSAP